MKTVSKYEPSRHVTSRNITAKLTKPTHNTTLQTIILFAPLVLSAVSGCASASDDAQTVFMPPQIQYVEVPVIQTVQAPQEQRELIHVKTSKKKSQRTVNPETVDAVTLFPYTENRIYKIATSPGYFTTVLFEPGEQMLGKAARSDNDPANWTDEKTTASANATAWFIKPARAGLSTNVFIATNKRNYQFDVTSYAKRAMDMVKFSVPQKEQQQVASAYQQPVSQSTAEFSPSSFYRNFKITVASGEKPRWMPEEVYEMQGKTYITFPQTLGQVSAPALFAVDGSGMSIPLQFRVRDSRFYEIDRQFANAELRQGDTIVTIRRNGA